MCCRRISDTYISTGIMQGGHGSATNLAVFDLEFEREANPLIEV